MKSKKLVFIVSVLFIFVIVFFALQKKQSPTISMTKGSIEESLEIEDFSKNNILLPENKEVAQQIDKGSLKDISFENFDVDSFVLLKLALDTHNDEIINAILENGVDVNITNHNQNTLLMLYADMGNVKIVKKLLFLGADINAIDMKGNKAIDFAKNKRHHEIVKILKNIDSILVE